MKHIKKYESFNITQNKDHEDLSNMSVEELLAKNYDQVSFIKGFENSTEEVRNDLDSLDYDWSLENDKKQKQHYKTHNISQFNLYANGPSHQVETDVTYTGDSGETLIEMLEELGWEIVKNIHNTSKVSGDFDIFWMVKEDKYLIEVFISETNFINSIGKIIS